MNLPILSLPIENSCGCVDTESGKSNECMCPATGLVQIIGRKYALRLLTVIGERQSMRFNDLKVAMDDISSSTLTIRLAELERAGKDEAGRPTGTSTARDSTSVNVEEREPIDPEMPNMPPA